MPYKAFFAPKVSVDHLQCVELSKAPECASEKAEKAQQRKEENEHIVKKLIKDFDNIRK